MRRSPFLTVAETGEIARVATSTVHTWIQSGKLSATKPGRTPGGDPAREARRVLIRKTDLAGFLGCSVDDLDG